LPQLSISVFNSSDVLIPDFKSRGSSPGQIRRTGTLGANRFISGSFLQNSKDIKETSKKLKELLEGGDINGS